MCGFQSHTFLFIYIKTKLLISLFVPVLQLVLL